MVRLNEVMFLQHQVPGRMGLSDFTTLKKVIISVNGEPLSHILYHFRLAYSGWCHIKVILGGESFSALSEGLREKIRCVITDLTMPEMDGRETLMALRKIQANLPVILVSGYDEAQAMEGFDSEKPQAFLRKPFSKAELEKALNKSLQPYVRP